MQPFLSIIIPTYNRPKEIIKCLDSLTRLHYPRERFEVIVVDDGSETDLEAAVAPFRRQMCVGLIQQTNAGPAAARNAGATQAKGEWLAFTDDDCMPDSDWLNILAAQFQKTPRCLVGGRTINALKDNRYSATSQLIVDIVYKHHNANPARAHFFASNNMAAPAQMFRDLGGFDPNFRFSEDREFCDRWQFHGHQMIFLPAAIVYHAREMSLASFFRQHFNYGCGAYRFHQTRARRGSGKFRTAFKFHLQVSNWLLYPFSQVSTTKACSLALLLAIWQLANALGFVWEGLHQKVIGAKRS